MNWRLAEKGDLDRLAAWNRALQVEEGARPLTVAENRARFERWLAGQYTAIVFETEVPAAYAVFRPTDPDSEGAGGVYLRQFFVAPETRRGRVGTRAFELFAREVIPGRRLVLEVLRSNPVGEAFWQSLGLRHYCSTYELPATGTDEHA